MLRQVKKGIIMLHEIIDLYKYFDIKKPEGAHGYLTVYCRDNAEEMPLDRVRPAMLVIPGGAYAYVSGREGEPVAIEYLLHGYNSFVLNYSVAPDFSFPTQIIEAAMAMIYIRENADKLHVDKNHVAAIGFSAGGHLTGCLGTMFDIQELAFLRNKELIRPDAILLCYPVTYYNGDNTKTHSESFENISANNIELAKRLSLETHVSKDSSPAFIWHTAADCVVPLDGSLILTEAYYKAGVPVEFHVFEKGDHGLSVCTEETNRVNTEDRIWIQASVNWLQLHGFKMFS